MSVKESSAYTTYSHRPVGRISSGIRNLRKLNDLTHPRPRQPQPLGDSGGRLPSIPKRLERRGTRFHRLVIRGGGRGDSLVKSLGRLVELVPMVLGHAFTVRAQRGPRKPP